MKYLFRFEEHCGDVYSRLPSIHTRVSGVLDWINSVIGDGKCGAQDDDNDGVRNDTGTPEQRIYSNNMDSSEFEYSVEADNEIETEGRIQGPMIAEESDLDEPELDPYVPAEHGVHAAMPVEAA